MCETVGLKVLTKHRCDKRLEQAIAETPNMKNAGTNVILRVSNKCLSLVNLDNNETILKHDMSEIAFVSGGDSVSYELYIQSL